MANRIPIVIADDHAVLRESLGALLQTQKDFDVVGKAGSGAEALELVNQTHPDVLVLDLFMPNTDGFEVLRTLDKAGSRVASVVLTGSENQPDYVQVVRLGARGLVLKGEGPERLFAAIRSVANGELAFSEDIAQQVLSAMAGEAKEEPSTIRRLSERERQIAALVARGMKNKDIAHELTISENTVKRHLQSIFNKTGARDRLELAVIALTELSKAA
ncbi:MAG TPA: response regulator transcription factor [Terriglobales bacterium]|jgi:DNA-binding NarL/FixJ family response regulator|nr:response regulator transcription factor [Terriglobales bacterium]HET7871499.1 response regulator transcription factor [Terriglobales bacterium]